MKNEDFSEASVTVRVLEKRLLSEKAARRVLEAPGFPEALKQIEQDSEYSFSGLKNPKDYETVIKEELKRVYALLYSMTEHRAVIDAATAKYEFHNLKVALKAKYLGKGFGRLYSDMPGITPPAKIEALINGENPEELPEYLKKAAAQAEEAYNNTKDPQYIDISLDKSLYARTLDLSEQTGSGFISEYVRMSVDFQNCKTLLRAKNMNKGARFLEDAMIEGGLTDIKFFVNNFSKPVDALPAAFFYRYFSGEIKRGLEGYQRLGNYAELEKIFDDRLIDHIKKAKYVGFGPEVLFAYALSKENEARQIRILAACKLNQAGFDKSGERLRDNYA